MSDEHEQDDASAPIDPEALGWSAPRPPDGFASRTVDAFLGDDDVSPEAPEQRRWPLVVAALSFAAAVVLAWAVWPVGRASTGEHAAQRGIATVRLHDRAIAVAQPQASLRWEIDRDGVARVEQDAGRVFYRVDEGGAFEVKTPAGTATVTGTCFEVEIVPMKNGASWKAGAVGAALAGAVIVTVYEGGVVLANDRGDVAVAAGERAVAKDGDTPRRMSEGEADPRGPSVAARGGSAAVSGDDAIAQLARQSRALEDARRDTAEQQEEIARLREQVRELGGDPGQPGPTERAARAKACATQSRGDCPFLDPDEQTLLEMAKCAVVKVDSPGWVDNPEAPDADKYAEQLGVTDSAEIEGLQAAATRHYDDFNRRLREIYLELGGDPTLAEDASPATLRSYVADQLDKELLGEIQRRIAEERAGLREPPAPDAPLPIEERFFRMHAGLGNEFESMVAAELGPARARALREVHDGWPGSTTVSSSDCRELP
jgi:hypothetical protein